MAKQPRWINPARKALLAKIAIELGKHGWEYDMISGKFHNPALDSKIQSLKLNWISYDRENSRYEYRFEYETRHKLITQRTYPYHSESGITHFNHAGIPHTIADSAIIRDLFYENQSCFEVIGIGISALNFKTYAKVRLAGGLETRFIDVSGALKPLSKHARRKALRYGNKSDGVDMAISHMVRRALNI